MNAEEFTQWLIPKIESMVPAEYANTLTGDTTILQSNLLDSMQFVELLAAIHQQFGIVIDFGEIDDFDKVTTVRGLADYAAQCANQG